PSAHPRPIGKDRPRPDTPPAVGENRSAHNPTPFTPVAAARSPGRNRFAYAGLVDGIENQHRALIAGPRRRTAMARGSEGKTAESAKSGRSGPARPLAFEAEIRIRAPGCRSV